MANKRNLKISVQKEKSFTLSDQQERSTEIAIMLQSKYNATSKAVHFLFII